MGQGFRFAVLSMFFVFLASAVSSTSLASPEEVSSGFDSEVEYAVNQSDDNVSKSELEDKVKDRLEDKTEQLEKQEEHDETDNGMTGFFSAIFGTLFG